MLFLIFLILAAFLAFVVFGFVLHLLFSPWVLLAAVILIAWIKFRPRHSSR